MPRLSNIIEEFIKNLLDETDNGVVEIQRNELAQYFDCAPSQINYVLTTRFTPYKGYYIESRRGGGGYIKIVKVGISEDSDINDLLVNTIGQSISKTKAYSIIERLSEEGIVTEREGDMMKIAIGDRTLKNVYDNRNELRADILKNMLLVLLRE
ncbi:MULTISPECIES: CtsR family transcriptional regulator [Tissierellales]|uniref:Transcriptional regulator CtsR n=1 Tax=Acidilutibacter cellobiosedens TaxID=2507161 RepID=A0A410QFD0_9FIRM|nr:MULTISPECIES: CtsR family transcriptional regulator [Tissierellales]MBE6082548.1 CtsR family transcriptional regulator [Tissierellaceae bacterium]QAT62707.1 CtsR family transcriptional regulator [Acidilutibacter cellobiosedens]SCL89889.1 Transcriptional regulator CtsR [Sporanaerobacter sp. PP17-6a]